MRYRVDDFQVFTDDQQPPAFTLSVNSIYDPGKVNGGTSTTIKVISTKEAKRILGSEYVAMVPRSDRPRLRIGDDDVDVYSTEVIPVEFSRDVIELFGVAGNATWFEYAKAKVLKDHDWGQDPEMGLGEFPGPLISYSNMGTSWGADSPGNMAYYPLVDHGNYEGEDDTFNVSLNMMRPGIRIGSAIFWALRDGGWNLVTRGKRAKREFYKYIEYGDTDKATAVSTPLGGGGLALTTSGTEQYEYFVHGNAPMPFPFSGTASGDGWVGYPDYKYTTQDNGAVYGSMNLDIPYTDDPSYQGRRFRVVLWDETDGVEVAGKWSDTISLTMTVAGTISFNFTIGSGYVPEGHVIYLGIVVDEEVDETVDVSSADGRLDFEGDYALGKYLVLASIMPEGTLATLMANIGAARGFVYNTLSDGTIEVWADEDYFRKPIPGDDYRDWSTRMDHSIAPIRSIRSRPAGYSIKYADDKDDRNLSRINRITRNAFGNHTESILLGTSAAVAKVLPWAASYMGSRFGGCIIPILTRENYDTDVDYKASPRLLIEDGTTPGTWKFYGSDRTNYPKCYFVLPPGTSQYPMAFGNPYLFGGGQETVLDNQLSHRARMMREGNVIEAYLFIKDHEIEDFDHGMPTLVDDGSGPAWFHVQEIQRHQFGVHTPTKCLLVEIPGAQVDIEDPVVTVPSYPPVFVCAGPGYVPIQVDEAGGAVYFVTTSGYFTLRSSVDESVTTYESATTVSDLDAGTYCAWPSDAAGNYTGEYTALGAGFGAISIFDIAGLAGTGPFQELVFDTAAITTYDIPYLLGATQLYVTTTPLVTLTIDANTLFEEIHIVDCALSEASVINVINAAYASALAGVLTLVDIHGGTSASPPSSVDDLMALLTGTADMQVVGAGATEANGAYTLTTAQNGRDAYVHSNGSEIYWSGTHWNIESYLGDTYRSAEDHAQPWRVTAWYAFGAAPGPDPTVTPPGFGLTITTN